MNGGGVFTIDSKNNLYMGHLYNTAVYKIPFVSGAYVTLSDLSSAPNCTGTDTAICTVANIPSGGIKAVAFDASGNLYMVSVPASPGVNAIYECAAACQTGGTATLVYSDTTGAVSQIAFDPWGNMFFTDGIYNDTAFANDDKADVFQPLRAALHFGNGLCRNASPAADLNRRLSCQLRQSAGWRGRYLHWHRLLRGPERWNVRHPQYQTGGPDTAHQYVVSALGAKGMELDANGNEWVVVYHSGGDNLGEALIGDLATPNAQYDGAR
jgi:hypothetical protein